MILVDYKCPDCGARRETLVSSPVPESRTCSGCGAQSRRLFTSAGLLRGGAAVSKVKSTDCFDNPDVPGLCHVGDAAKRTLVARFRGDDDALKAEQKRQTIEFERHGPPPLAKVAAHAHAPSTPTTPTQ